MFVFTVDDEIELRLHERWHAEELFQLVDDNREHLAPWFPWVESTREVSDTREFIDDARELWNDSEAIMTSIWFCGEMAGTLGLEGLNWDVDCGEIGYWLGKSFEGNGIVTRSCRSIIGYAFEVMELNRIVIRSMPSNERSIAVAKRLGFEYEGTLREVAKVDDELRDLEVYSMLRREWNADAKKSQRSRKKEAVNGKR